VSSFPPLLTPRAGSSRDSLTPRHFGILIRPDSQLILDIQADAWTDEELQRQLRLPDGDLVRYGLERSGDAIVLSAFLNTSTAGKPFRIEGFDLYGDRFYGPAIIIPGDELSCCPALDPHDISRVIRFFRQAPHSALTS